MKLKDGIEQIKRNPDIHNILCTDKGIKDFPIDELKVVQEQLQVLNLSSNKLTEVPDDITDLFQLRELLLFDNRISQISPRLSSLSKLTFLNLSVNNLTELPSGFNCFSSLIFLDLAGNKLTRLKSSFGDLTTLRVLHLADNMLESLPDEIGKLVNLETFVIRDNKIKVLPNTLGSLINLRELYAQGNLITHFQPSISNTLLGSTRGKFKLAGNPLAESIIKVLGSSSERGVLNLMTYLRTPEYVEEMKKEGFPGVIPYSGTTKYEELKAEAGSGASGKVVEKDDEEGY